MGSATGAYLHTIVTSGADQSSVQSSDRSFAFNPSSSPTSKCRKRRTSKNSSRYEAWFNEDIWISIMLFLDPMSLLRLAVTNRQFCALAKEDVIWKSMFLSDIEPSLSIDTRPAFSSMNLYLAACDGSHAYSYDDSEKHLDWARIGIFRVNSGEAVATDRLMDMKLISETSSNTSHLNSYLLQSYLIQNVKKGFWIADMHLLNCPVCNLDSCEGFIQALAVRHWELFLNKEYKTGEWKHKQVYTRHVTGHCNEASAWIFDANQLQGKAWIQVQYTTFSTSIHLQLDCCDKAFISDRTFSFSV